ncbi:uncharacterized protein FOMMEDRAFT_168674 [Fomitiporia mediterranea MF3/22]|uniref:uncharacterized protein n=1 Tax=Fomitiporia mediterranea (strain MF3/22) TaxID=694068 RepID=UPI0004407E11|nr:uncharacterized protein FOMMEDRAFT_168674 [Fomitiporia mediterranea MF3/22]EJD02143.1 hypothetical protein FOMMEDRAFT_168674 [Fomitiporia mediterranea MF3/22]
MAELGLAMGENGILPEEVHYALQPDGQYQPVLPPNAQPADMGNPENQYQPSAGGQTGGQTFASTLLLSLSCSPLLKAHLLRSLSMTNEELCSLEPILSAAWDQWDHARRLHYAEQVAQASRQQQGDQQHPEQQQQQTELQQNGPGPSAGPPPPPSHPFGPPPMSDQHDPNDFRSRFHRPLTAPSPFGTIPMPGAAAQIDPNLNGGPSSTAFAEAVAKVAMAANGQNVQANGLVDGDADAEGGSGSEDAEADVSTEKDELEGNNKKES